MLALPEHTAIEVRGKEIGSINAAKVYQFTGKGKERL